MLLPLLVHKILYLEKLTDKNKAMKEVKRKKIVQIFSDGSLNFDYTIVKRSKKINFYTQDHKNLFLNQKNSNESFSPTNENFKTKYI
nr:hypothetical protein CCFAOBFC_00041 [Haslea ostrearia]